MVFLRFLRQNTVARVMRLSGLSPALAAMFASSSPAQIKDRAVQGTLEGCSEQGQFED